MLTPRFFKLACQIDRRLPAELDDDAFRLFQVDDFMTSSSVSGSKYSLSEMVKSVDTVSGLLLMMIAS